MATIRARCALVMAKDVALRSVAAVVREERLGGAGIQPIHRAVPTLALQHHHRGVARAEQAEYPGRALLGIVQDHGGCFAFGRRAPFADTNIQRVLGRFFLGRPATNREAVALDAEAMPRRSADLWHHALMDLGATLCKPRDPSCDACPLKEDCRFALASAAGRHPDGLTGRLDQQATRNGPRDRAMRPAAYKDTDRRVRGAIVRALTARDMTVRSLEKEIGDERVGRLTEALVADGLVERAGRGYRLPL